MYLRLTYSVFVQVMSEFALRCICDLLIISCSNAL
jgi:hypothetical protein